jgi:hypothetical protein
MTSPPSSSSVLRGGIEARSAFSVRRISTYVPFSPGEGGGRGEAALLS